MTERVICPTCLGVGFQQNVAMGLMMGELIGVGYLPQTQICLACSGTGRVEATR